MTKVQIIELSKNVCIVVYLYILCLVFSQALSIFHNTIEQTEQQTTVVGGTELMCDFVGKCCKTKAGDVAEYSSGKV